MKISELLTEDAKGVAFEKLVAELSRTKMGTSAIRVAVDAYVKSFGKLSVGEAITLERAVGYDVEEAMIAFANQSEKEWYLFFKKYNKYAKFADGTIKALNYLAALGIPLTAFNQYRRDMEKLDAEFAKGGMSQKVYDDTRHAAFADALQKMQSEYLIWIAAHFGVKVVGGVTKFGFDVARLGAKPATWTIGKLFNLFGTYKRVALFGGKTWETVVAGIAPAGMIGLAAWLNSEEGVKWLSAQTWYTVWAPFDLEATLLEKMGVMQIIDQGRVKIQNLINEAAGEPKVDYKEPGEKDKNPVPANPNDPTQTPLRPGDSATRHYQSYDTLGQYTPASQGVLPEPDKKKWKDIGNGLIQDPNTGVIADKPR